MNRLIFLCLFFFGCNSEYISPTHYTESIKITWHRTDNPEQVCRTVIGKESSSGCAKWDSAKENCHIYVPQIRYSDDSNTLILGHETAHCFIGRYH